MLIGSFLMPGIGIVSVLKSRNVTNVYPEIILLKIDTKVMTVNSSAT